MEEVLAAASVAKRENPDYCRAVGVLRQICADPAVPRSVKKRVEGAVAKLTAAGQNLRVRINSCTSLLDDISNDPNVPPHTRTFIWQVAGMLESAGKAEPKPEPKAAVKP